MTADVYVLFFQKTVRIAAPSLIARRLQVYFALAKVEPSAVDIDIRVQDVPNGGFDVSIAGISRERVPDFGGVLRRIVSTLYDHFISTSVGSPLVAGAVGWGDKAILVIGTRLDVGDTVAWLVERGFSYISHGLVQLGADHTLTDGFAGPLVIGGMAVAEFSQSEVLKAQPSVPSDGLVFLQPDIAWSAPALPLACSLILEAKRDKGAGFQIRELDVGRAYEKLVGGLGNASLQAEDEARARRLLDEVPGFSIRYDAFEGGKDTLDRLIRFIVEDEMTKPEVDRLLKTIAAPESRAEAAQNPIPARTNRNLRPRLTIGMATFDDYDGVYFSIQSLRMYHPEVMEQAEIIVIDNNPTGACSKALKDLERSIPNYRYIPEARKVGTSVRDSIFEEAFGDYVLSMDCHVLFPSGALASLLGYFDANPDTCDLIQGPLLDDDLKRVSSHWDPVWRKGMYGIWANLPAAEDPEAAAFEIPMQGLGVFACRRDVWPGFNPDFRGFGGEEGYIHEKFRQRGGRVMCLPALRWMHRFNRPMGPTYPVKWGQIVRNYMIGFKELGLDVEPVKAHFREHLGDKNADGIIAEIEKEFRNPFRWFDAIHYINLDASQDKNDAMQKRLVRLGIENFCSRFPAVETPANHHIGCALSHRAIIAQAKRRGLKNVLVFEDDAVFRRDTLELLPQALEELASCEWDILYLGGHIWGEAGAPVDGCSFMRVPHTITTTHAVAYNESSFDKILADIPDNEKEMEHWLVQWRGIDQYLNKADFRRLRTEPMLALQPNLFDQPDSPPRSAFVF